MVAPREWDAIRASKMLKIAVSRVRSVLDEDKLYDYIRNASVTKREVTSDKGSVDTAFANAAHVVEADYALAVPVPCQHGRRLRAGRCARRWCCWTGSQKPHYAAQGVAAILGIPVEKVHAIWAIGPGSHGRNDAGDALMGCRRPFAGGGQAGARAIYARRGTGWTPRRRHRCIPRAPRWMRRGAWWLSNSPPRGSPASIPTATRTDVKDTLAGQLLVILPASAKSISVRRNTPSTPNERVAWETIPTLLPTASPLRTTHMRDPWARSFTSPANPSSTKWRRRRRLIRSNSACATSPRRRYCRRSRRRPRRQVKRPGRHRCAAAQRQRRHGQRPCLCPAHRHAGRRGGRCRSGREHGKDLGAPRHRGPRLRQLRTRTRCTT